MIIDLILYFSKGISFVGVIIDKLIFWSWLMLTVFIVVTRFKEAWVKTYSVLLSIFLFLSFMPMGVPFFMIVGYAIYFEKSIYSDDLRIAYTSKSPLAGPYLYISESYLLFEKEIGKIDLDQEINGKHYTFSDVKKIRKLCDEKSETEFLIEFNNGIESNFKVE